jgi:hypothetical protein
MFSYQQTFQNLLVIFKTRLQAEGRLDKLEIIDIVSRNGSKKQKEIIDDSNHQFDKDAVHTSQLNEDLASFANAFFLPKNSALVINRSFSDPNKDSMQDVAEMVSVTDFSSINPPIITFIYRSGRHFMSVVINANSGEIRFANSMGTSDCNFSQNAREFLLPKLTNKFGKEFFITHTKTADRIEQIGDATTCNFHSMFNNIIWSLQAGGKNMSEICAVISNVFGEQIVAENLQSLLAKCAELFTTEEQKANLQKRMICAAQIYRTMVSDVYDKSTSHINSENAINQKSKFDAFLNGIVERIKATESHQAYQLLADKILVLNNSGKETLLSNNFSLNPDLRLRLNQQQLNQYLSIREQSLAALAVEQNIMANVITEIFIIIDSFYESIGDGEITPEHIQNAVDLIKEGVDINNLKRTISDQQLTENYIAAGYYEDEAMGIVIDGSVIDGNPSYTNQAARHHNNSHAAFESRRRYEQNFDARRPAPANKVEIPDDQVSDIHELYGRLHKLPVDKNLKTTRWFNGYNPLHLAALFGNDELIIRLKKIDFDFNALDDDGCNGLHLLLNQSECEISTVQLLLGNGANPNQPNQDGDTAFHVYCQRADDANITEELIKNGADVNAVNSKSGITALEMAINYLTDGAEEGYKEGDFDSLKAIVASKNFKANQHHLNDLQGLLELTPENIKEEVESLIEIVKKALPPIANNNVSTDSIIDIAQQENPGSKIKILGKHKREDDEENVEDSNAAKKLKPSEDKTNIH